MTDEIAEAVRKTAEFLARSAVASGRCDAVFRENTREAAEVSLSFEDGRGFLLIVVPLQPTNALDARAIAFSAKDLCEAAIKAYETPGKRRPYWYVRLFETRVAVADGQEPAHWVAFASERSLRPEDKQFRGGRGRNSTCPCGSGKKYKKCCG